MEDKKFIENLFEQCETLARMKDKPLDVKRFIAGQINGLIYALSVFCGSMELGCLNYDMFLNELCLKDEKQHIMSLLEGYLKNENN